MSARVLAPTLCALLCLPAAATAGPIEFTLATGWPTVTSDAPQIGMTLVPSAGQTLAADRDATTPVSFDVATYQPGRIPTPAPGDVHPGGYTHWNNDGYFTVPVTVTDVASGDSATLAFGGRAHLYSDYTTDGGWTGNAFFWFQDGGQVTLGGNLYTLQGANQFFGPGGYGPGAPITLDVWVGNGAPAYTPEPGTLALVALGLAPLGLRRLRRSLHCSA